MTQTDRHFECVVLPALREYLEAERGLTQALAGGISASVESARATVMRRARTAAIELHQLADHAAKNSRPAVAVEAIRSQVETHCVFLREGGPVDDITLLRDVAEAFKHHTLDRKSATVRGADAVVASTTGYSMLYFGEGKFGGVEQVVVTRKDGAQRALSSVFQNATDAWRRHLGRPLPPIGEYDT
jgi:hypothetical protein